MGDWLGWSGAVWLLGAFGWVMGLLAHSVGGAGLLATLACCWVGQGLVVWLVRRERRRALRGR